MGYLRGLSSLRELFVVVNTMVAFVHYWIFVDVVGILHANILTSHVEITVPKTINGIPTMPLLIILLKD